MKSPLFDRLSRAVQEDAALRRVRRMQPAGGTGDKLFPPTYPGARNTDPARHVFERRRVGGSDVLCVLIDSVQSQANRLEEALREAKESGELAFPAIAVDFSKSDVSDIGRITTLDAPHRVFDAIIRDSELSGKPFGDTNEGRRLVAANSHRARALYEISPTALVFGAWNSTGQGGGLGAKFPRCVVSEIVGVGVAVESDARTGQTDVPSGKRTGSRVDPLGIRSGVAVFKTEDGWSLDPPKKAKDAKSVRPSEVNHSNIAPTVDSLGVSVDHVLHTFVLSFAALRRLRFPEGTASTPEADVAGRTALAALALASGLAQDRAGYFLRSRCDLVPEAAASAAFEIVRADGTTEPLAVDLASVRDVLRAAVARAAAAGLKWRDTDIVLTPQPKLVGLVVKSREKALRGEVEPESES